MTKREASDQLARLLLQYCRRGRESLNGPDHEAGWWFTAAPPATVRDALALVLKETGERPNDQPPEDWLVDRAEQPMAKPNAEPRAPAGRMFWLSRKTLSGS
jgi:hypothetical protein